VGQNELDEARRELIEQADALQRLPLPALQDVKSLIGKLKREEMFDIGRALLAAVLPKYGQEPWVRQQAALCTYKDTALPVRQGLDRAWEILAGTDGKELAADSESLGIAGAIFKRRWQADAEVRHLVRSLEYYERGHAVADERDCGYTGINAAFILDLLADLEETEARQSGGVSESGAARRKRADAIRVELIAQLTQRIGDDDEHCNAGSYWALVTLAEAHYGRCNYDEAGERLMQAKATEHDPWERQSTAEQLGVLARLRPPDDGPFERSAASRVLAEFLGASADSVYSAYRGKVGLALSGGGLRASFFHLGVLARLAEMDLLRHVQVLSCVSGGSLVGAHYYLELQQLLQEKPEAELATRDYVELVTRVQRGFLEGARKNIRMRLGVNPFINLKMAFWPGYTRTRRAGELYEKHLYAKVPGKPHSGWRRLAALRVQPALDPDHGDFNPRKHNWRRGYKVPMLVINATSLNTGHDWQFTASWMGEPPTGIDEDVDATYRLRRLYYEEAPGKYPDLSLGQSVAASAAVPGLFDPILMRNLYEHEEVRLADGGVHDNQGIASLIEQDCSVVIVSDASGQMEGRPKPSGAPLGVLLRSNSILMSRVRESQYRDLLARRSSGLLRGMMFLHLHKDLATPPRTWIGGTNRPAWDEAKPQQQKGLVTPYGVRRDMQHALAGIRTDLDAFCDVEAYALMTSGYKMASESFDECLPEFATTPAALEEWDFLVVEPSLSGYGDPPASDRVLEILQVGKNRFLKLSRRFRPLMALDIAFVIVLAIALTLLAIDAWDRPALTIGGVWKLIAGFVAVALFGKFAEWILRAINARASLIKVAGGVALAFGGCVIVAVGILLSKIYLRTGRVS
jgi:predicted acylesterase/phospholipase RssA